MKKGIIFDLDGTLWNSIETIIPAWNRVLTRRLGEEKILTPEYSEKLMGLTLDKIGEMVLPDVDKQERMDVLNECCREECIDLKQCGGKLYPHLRETLEYLKGYYGLYIVSNCQDGYIESFLEYHKFKDIFDDIEYVGRTGRTKGENILEIIKRNGLIRSVYVGDTQGDLDAADIASIPFIYAGYGFGQVNRKTYKIDSITMLPDLVKEII